MANGKIHDLVTGIIAIALPFAPSAIEAKYPGVIHLLHLTDLSPVVLGLGAITGLMIGPDNDLYQSRPSKRWLMLNELLFWPYRAWVGSHRVPSCRSCFGRNPKSHLPILSTFPRLPYAALLLSPLLWLAVQDGIQGWEVAIAIQYTIGLMAADIGHWAADGILS